MLLASNKFKLKKNKKMKKLIFMVCAAFALSFMACGNRTTKAAGASDSDTVTVDSLDSVATDSAVSVAK